MRDAPIQASAAGGRGNRGGAWVFKDRFFRPLGLASFSGSTHSLRCRLYSCAASVAGAFQASLRDAYSLLTALPATEVAGYFQASLTGRKTLRSAELLRHPKPSTRSRRGRGRDSECWWRLRSLNAGPSERMPAQKNQARCPSRSLRFAGPFDSAQGRLARRPSPHEHRSCQRHPAELRSARPSPRPGPTRIRPRLARAGGRMRPRLRWYRWGRRTGIVVSHRLEGCIRWLG